MSMCMSVFLVILLHGMRTPTFWLAALLLPRKENDLSNFWKENLWLWTKNLLYCRTCDFSVPFEVWEEEPENIISNSFSEKTIRTWKWSLNIFCSNEKPRRTKGKRRRWVPKTLKNSHISPNTIQSLFSIHRVLSRKLSMNWKRMSIWSQKKRTWNHGE